MSTMTEFPVCSQPVTEWDDYDMTPEEEDAETQRGLRSLMERCKPCRGCWSHYRENLTARIVCDCTEEAEAAAEAAAAAEQLHEPPALLRIRIPPFEEIQEELVIPYWPNYGADATGAQKLAVDCSHVGYLVKQAEVRHCEEEKAELCCEIFTYLRHRPLLLETSEGFRKKVLAKIEEIERDIANGTIQTFWNFNLKSDCSRLKKVIERIVEKKGA